MPRNFIAQVIDVRTEGDDKHGNRILVAACHENGVLNYDHRFELTVESGEMNRLLKKPFLRIRGGFIGLQLHIADAVVRVLIELPGKLNGNPKDGESYKICEVKNKGKRRIEIHINGKGGKFSMLCNKNDLDQVEGACGLVMEKKNVIYSADTGKVYVELPWLK